MESPSEKLADVSGLIAEIEEAFAGVSLGKGVRWREADAIDNHATPEERAAARRFDVDTNWKLVVPELLNDLPSAVSFLDAAGFRYYLPAFIADIRRAGHWESAVDDSFLADLASPQRLGELLPLLNGAQRRSICHWIRHQSHRTPWYRPAAEIV